MANRSAPPADWQHVLDEGDETAFERLVEPFTDEMLRAARADLAYHVDQGHLHDEDLTAEEVVGEALIHAWERRAQRPPEMPLKSWLLGVQHRALRDLVAAHQAYRRDKALSLDEPVRLRPDNQDPQEWFRLSYEPDLTLEAVTPAQEPIDIEAPLDPSDATFTLDPDTRHVVMMHDEFDMNLSDVAFVMNLSIEETTGLLKQARTALRASNEQ